MKDNSLEGVYILYMNDIYRYLLRLSGHPQTAEDLVQDTFIKAYDYLESYKGENIRPWLFRIAYNAYIDWFRKEKRHVQTEPGLMEKLNKSVGPSPEEQILLQERIDSWLVAVYRLPEKQKQAIILRDYHDFSYQEISQILDLSITSVKVNICRARQKVKEAMSNEV